MGTGRGGGLGEAVGRGSYQGLVVQEGNVQEKMFTGVKSPGVIVQEGNYSGVIIQRAKVRRIIFLRRIL